MRFGSGKIGHQHAGDYVAASADGSDLSAGLLDLFDRKVFGQNPHIAIPNILSERRLVPELVQQAATPEAMYHALLGELDKSQADPNYLQAFDHLHRELAMGVSGLGASTGAALGVVDLLREKGRLPSSA